jgi:hypothetical protein
MTISQPRAEEERKEDWRAPGTKAGVKVTMHHMEDATGEGVGDAFPSTEYPFVRQWIRTVGLNVLTCRELSNGVTRTTFASDDRA